MRTTSVTSKNPTRRGPVSLDDLDVRSIDFQDEAEIQQGGSSAGGHQAGAQYPFAYEMPDDPIEQMTRFLGAALTTASEVWSPQSVDRMRSLQKAFIIHSLKLQASDRAPLLQAINVVENAVQFRLRLEQMRRSEMEKDNEAAQAELS